MRPLFLSLGALLLAVSVSAQNKLTIKEREQGWQLLFNGTSTTGWHNYLKPTASAAWSVKNGELSLDPAAPGQGDLVTDKEYENFELSLDWNISPEGNSGIIFGVHEDSTLKQTYLSGIEMQILDDKGAEDNKLATHLAGSLYDMRAPSQNTVKPAGDWNKAVIWKKDGHLKFWLNDVQVIDVQIGSADWNTLLFNSKFKSWANFAKCPKGHIALQDHNHKVSFKNIKIRTL
ncbi:3-keto-disaccharide hydrolase [Mucilaginibacter ginkgonis]|uniref:DUF1080 domain-containing protein n=1 Tax=Mucilaginibacter ginkgonis TaxID=2682091 RepID=A0A6I4HZL9_9SPHI|nr:DUF1080 domain-containing protein [Mucilaginibacter ginkgonis]QQL49415.1 DUF1080 domain-containing protein [Mucilaginibacter ginkgonis]